MQNQNKILLVILPIVFSVTSAFADEPFKLNAEEQGFRQNTYDSNSYPAPKMLPSPSSQNIRQSGQIQSSTQVPKKAPMKAAGQATKVALPSSFLGVWIVQGIRSKVEGTTPEFQAQANNAFSVNTNNTWEISGDPTNGYTMGSNTGAKAPIIVDQVQGGTAFIRYQHPIGKTIAQEAIVMSLAANGKQFQGLERITIVKQNEPPRCRVTYQLSAIRQR